MKKNIIRIINVLIMLLFIELIFNLKVNASQYIVNNKVFYKHIAYDKYDSEKSKILYKVREDTLNVSSKNDSVGGKSRPIINVEPKQNIKLYNTESITISFALGAQFQSITKKNLLYNSNMADVKMEAKQNGNAYSISLGITLKQKGDGTCNIYLLLDNNDIGKDTVNGACVEVRINNISDVR